jgi:hypothetical protein
LNRNEAAPVKVDCYFGIRRQGDLEMEITKEDADKFSVLVKEMVKPSEVEEKPVVLFDPHCEREAEEIQK